MYRDWKTKFYQKILNTKRVKEEKKKEMFFNILGILLFFVIFSPILFQGHFVHTEALTWNQTDWSEGAGSSTTNQYFSKVNTDTSSSGEASLALNGQQFSNLGMDGDLTGWSTSSIPDNFFDTKSVDLDGTNEYILVDNDSSLVFGNGTTDSPFSISIWIYIDSYDSESWDILSKATGSIEYQFLVLESTQEARINLYSSAGNVIGRDSDVTISPERWYHIVSTYDGSGDISGINLYINGEDSTGDPFTAGTYTAMNNTGASLNFGVIPTVSRYSNGKIDEPSIWDKELSSAEVSEIYNDGIAADLNDHSAVDNIISWWRMGEGSDSLASEGTINDVIGTNDGTAKNTEAADAVSLVPGIFTSTITHNTSTTTVHNASVGSAKIISSSSTFDFTQSVNVGDTETYTLEGYVYTDGSEVTSSDAQLVVNGVTSTINTTYTDDGSGWYKLTATTTGAASSIAYGVQVKMDKTVYIDDMSLYDDAPTSTLTSNIFDADLSAEWGVFTFATSGTGMIALQARTDSASDMSGAPDFSTCETIISGSDISRNNCVTDGDRYIQYKAVLTATEPTLTPALTDINLRYVINSRPAEEVIPLRIATYNTYIGLGADGSDKNNAIEKHINRVQPDIISLQEIDNNARTLLSGGWASDLGYDYVESATPDNNILNPSLLSKYPILNSHYVSSTSGGDEFNLRFLFTEIDISSLTTQKKLGIYSIHTSPWCNASPCEPPNAPNATTQFERAVQFLRLIDDINATRATNPTMEIIVLGDHNDDTSDTTQPSFFSSDPGGHSGWFTLGSDITFPVNYGRFPEEQYASVDMTFADAKRLDGEYYTIPYPSPNSAFVGPSRLDYIAVSEGIEFDGSEVLDSETDGTGGLTKYNSVLTTGDSNTASDHSLVFADISLTIDATPPVLSLDTLSPDPGSNSKPVFTGTVTDADNTVSSVEFQMNGTSGSWTACTADDGTFDEANENFTCSLSTDLSSGSYTIFVRSTDSFGNVTVDADAATDTFAIVFGGGGGQPSAWANPPILPEGEDQFEFFINSGQGTTDSRIVSAHFSAGSDVKKMAISLSQDFSDAIQEDYSPTKQIDLCSKSGGAIIYATCPEGQYTLYVKFYTAYGVASDVFSQTIHLVAGSQPSIPPSDIFDTPQIPEIVETFTKDFQRGIRDIQVRILQQFLNQVGFFVAHIGAGSPGRETDYFGPLTSGALAQFQEANGTEDPRLFLEKGYLGPITRAFINAVIGDWSIFRNATPESPSAIFSTSLYRGMRSDDVWRLQGLFATRPDIYPEGLVTGYFGPLTQKAAQRFQLQYGVVLSPADLGFGIVGPRTRAKLQDVFGENQ